MDSPRPSQILVNDNPATHDRQQTPPNEFNFPTGATMTYPYTPITPNYHRSILRSSIDPSLVDPPSSKAHQSSGLTTSGADDHGLSPRPRTPLEEQLTDDESLVEEDEARRIGATHLLDIFPTPPRTPPTIDQVTNQPLGTSPHQHTLQPAMPLPSAHSPPHSPRSIKVLLADDDIEGQTAHQLEPPISPSLLLPTNLRSVASFHSSLSSSAKVTHLSLKELRQTPSSLSLPQNVKLSPAASPAPSHVLFRTTSGTSTNSSKLDPFLRAISDRRHSSTITTDRTTWVDTTHSNLSHALVSRPESPQLPLPQQTVPVRVSTRKLTMESEQIRPVEILKANRMLLRPRAGATSPTDSLKQKHRLSIFDSQQNSRLESADAYRREILGKTGSLKPGKGEAGPGHLPDWDSLTNDRAKKTSQPIDHIRQDLNFALSKMLNVGVFEDFLNDEELKIGSGMLTSREKFREWISVNMGRRSLRKLDLWTDVNCLNRMRDQLVMAAVGIRELYCHESTNQLGWNDPSLAVINRQTQESVNDHLYSLIHSVAMNEIGTPNMNDEGEGSENQGDRVMTRIERDLLESLFDYEFKSFTKNMIVERFHVRLGKFDLSQSERQGLGDCFCLTNPRMRDHPIVLVSEGFTKITGYEQDQILGRNCRFLQGPSTSPESVQRIRDGLNSGDGCTELLLNYRKDGTPFYCLLCIIPLRDTAGSLVYFIGGQVNVTGLLSGKKPLSFLLTDSGGKLDHIKDKSNTRNGFLSFQCSPTLETFVRPEPEHARMASSITGKDSISRSSRRSQGGAGDHPRMTGEFGGPAAGSITYKTPIKENEKLTVVNRSKKNWLLSKFWTNGNQANPVDTLADVTMTSVTTKPVGNKLAGGVIGAGSSKKVQQLLHGAEYELSNELKPLDEHLKSFESLYSRLIIFKRESRQMIFVTKSVLKFLGMKYSNQRDIYKSSLIQSDFVDLIWAGDSNGSAVGESTPDIRKRIKKVIKSGEICSVECHIRPIERNLPFFSKEDRWAKSKPTRLHLTPLVERQGEIAAYVCVLG